MHWHWEDRYALEDTGAKKRNWRILKKLLPYFRNYLKTIIIASFLLLFSTLLTLLGPILIKRAIDVEIPNKSAQGLLIIAVIYIVIQIVVLLVRYFQQIEIMTVGEKAIADLKADIFRHLLKLPLSYFDKHPVGALISRVESDTEALKFLFSSTAVVLVSNIALLVGMSVVMFVVSWRLYLLILVMMPIFAYSFWWFEKHVRNVYVNLRKKIAEINGFVVETAKSLNVVQMFRQEDNFISKVNKLGKGKYDYEMQALSFWYRIWFFVELGEIIGIVLVLGIGGVWALGGLITIGTLYLFISYITRLFVPLRGISDQINVIERAFAAAERVFQILSTAEEFQANETHILSEFGHAIQFKDLSFFYEDKNWVLKDLNFQIKKGERIALVGETGGGKTSIISLLLKYYSPQDGDILIDGTPIAEIERHSLRSRIGFVPQDVILFPGTILDNLRLFDATIADAKIHEAAKRAKIHKRILNLPDGYDTNIIEQGINLSFGERQLVSYTRALVFDPQILILDEATSSVDPQSERLVQEGLRELLKGRTAIIIAHRLTTTRLADRVMVIHKGKLVENGNHSELLKERGHYYKMYRLQYLSGVQ
ncbi:MAG: ABC transporter ATP-binding protein [candidate division WOR-3 bacterium]|nr:MAG: ABC transporter ATP-binding protein [candidate division WOR-3 bacterium]